MRELAECPFCGEDEAELASSKTLVPDDDGFITEHYVRCSHCGAQGPASSHSSAREAAQQEAVIAAWNRRSIPV